MADVTIRFGEKEMSRIRALKSHLGSHITSGWGLSEGNDEDVAFVSGLVMFAVESWEEDLQEKAVK